MSLPALISNTSTSVEVKNICVFLPAKTLLMGHALTARMFLYNF
jgi:hypothetical protein